MNPWKISTFVLGLSTVGLLALGASDGSALQGSFDTSLSRTAEVDIMKAVVSVHDELGYSTWSLEDLAKKDQTNYANTIDFMADHIGTSTWTLNTLASHISNQCD